MRERLLRLLMRAYPRAWRERYADELISLVQERPLRIRDVVSLLRAAASERLAADHGEGIRVMVRVGIGALGLAASAFALTDTALGWLIPFTVLGGSVIALARLALRPRRAGLAHDRFAGDVVNVLDPINVSHVRVAGIGGAGLLVVALVVSLQFQLLTAVMTAGLAGGAAGALAVILFRRRTLGTGHAPSTYFVRKHVR